MGDENIELVFLGFLFEKPKHGYELFKEISDPVGFSEVYRLKIGKMYSILKKLENQKLIYATIQNEGNRPPRKLYSLSKSGQIAFNDWMITPLKHGRDFRIMFLLKMFFLDRSETETIKGKELISKQSQECRKWEKRISQPNNNPKVDSSYQRMVKQYRLFQIEGYSKWLDWCERMINEKNTTY